MAAQSLGTLVQARNTRKVKINANVTFFIWILEWVANISIVIAWVFASKYTNTFPEFGLFWYYLVLPNTYLMNTSHNKERIIDDGLKTTIRNAFGAPFDFKLYGMSPWKDEHTQNQSVSGQVRQSKNRELDESKSIKNEYREPSVAGVYVLSKPQYSAFTPTNPFNTNRAIPTTSKGHMDTTKKQKPSILYQKSVSDPEQEVDYVGAQTNSRLCIGTKLLSHMKENVNAEVVYLHYFVQLIDFEDRVKTRDFCLMNFEIVNSDHLNGLHTAKVAKAKGNRKKQSCTSKGERSIKWSTAQSAIDPMMILKSNLLKNILHKGEKRKIMLEAFHKYCNTEDSYEKYLNDLIDLEESLVEN